MGNKKEQQRMISQECTGRHPQNTSKIYPQQNNAT